MYPAWAAYFLPTKFTEAWKFRLSTLSFSRMPLAPNLSYPRVKFNDGKMFWVVRMWRFVSSLSVLAKNVPQYANSVYGVLVLYIGRVEGEWL